MHDYCMTLCDRNCREGCLPGLAGRRAWGGGCGWDWGIVNGGGCEKRAVMCNIMLVMHLGPHPIAPTAQCVQLATMCCTSSHLRHCVEDDPHPLLGSVSFLVYPRLHVGLHAGAVFTVDTATVWVCRLRPVRRKLRMLTVRLTVRNGDTGAV